MNKNEILLYSKRGANTRNTLIEVLGDSYTLINVFDIKDAIDILTSGSDIMVVMIDYPSEIPGAQELIDFVDKNNRSVFNIPILILTSQEKKFADSEFLGGPVADVMVRPFVPAIISNRLKVIMKQFDSVSFEGFSLMLKALPSNIYLKDAEGRYIFSAHYWHHLRANEPGWTIRGKTEFDIQKDPAIAKKSYEADRKMIETIKFRKKRRFRLISACFRLYLTVY